MAAKHETSHSAVVAPLARKSRIQGGRQFNAAKTPTGGRKKQYIVDRQLNGKEQPYRIMSGGVRGSRAPQPRVRSILIYHSLPVAKGTAQSIHPVHTCLAVGAGANDRRRRRDRAARLDGQSGREITAHSPHLTSPHLSPISERGTLYEVLHK